MNSNAGQGPATIPAITAPLVRYIRALNSDQSPIQPALANLWIFLFQGCLVSNVLALELFKYLVENLIPCRSQLFAGLDQISVKFSTYAMVSYRRKIITWPKLFRPAHFLSSSRSFKFGSFMHPMLPSPFISTIPSSWLNVSSDLTHRISTTLR